MVLELYKKTTLPNKVLADCLVTLLWKNRKEISKYIIKDRVNKENIDEYINEFVDYVGKNNLDSGYTKEIYDLLLNIKESK